nr:unnamed protein product [Callosobruchus chinensis]
MGSEHYCLRWNNHQSNLLGVFSQLLRDESLVDVTLACSEGHSIRAHKVVLSACSSYFQSLFVDHPSRHPIVILKDVRFSELRTLVEFMYKGEVNVEYCQLSALLKTAESLKVKGLAEMTREYKPPEEEQTEPKELVNRRPPPPAPAPPPVPASVLRGRSMSPDDMEEDEEEPLPLPPRPISQPASSQPHSPPQNLRVCKSPPSSMDEDSGGGGGGGGPPRQDVNNTSPPPAAHHLQKKQEEESSCPGVVTSIPPPPLGTSDCGASDMSMHSNSVLNVAATSVVNPLPPSQLQLHQAVSALATSLSSSSAASSCSNRLPSPMNCDPVPVPGPSNMPPVQQVPLSLKKEVDWGGGEDKSPGEGSSDFNRHQDSATSDTDKCIGSPVPDRPSSTQSSRSSTPFALPFPTIPTSLLEVGLMHPASLLSAAADDLFRCGSCLASFPSPWLLEQHAALQHVGASLAAAAAAAAAAAGTEKPFVCEQCGQSYRYRSAYVKHREQNHRARLPADKLFSCDVCGMQFRYLKSFKKHRLNHALEKLHGKSSSEIAKDSKYCVDEEHNRSALENSSDQVSSSNETINIEEEESPIVVKKEITDEAAGEGTSSDAEKEDTEVDQDDTVDSMVTAEYSPSPAPASSVAATTGGSHPAPVTSPEPAQAHHSHHEAAASLHHLLGGPDTQDRQRERRFACPFCGKCVRSKENLKLHVRKHTGERPFVCLFCGRAFGGKSDLTRHLRIHTGERPYHCDMCGKCFARADYLSKHLTTHINTPR